MREHLAKAFFVLILALVLLALAAPYRGSFNVAAQRRWIQQTVQELAQKASPPFGLKQCAGDSSENTWWRLPGYLIFSNGWAAYKINTIHNSSKVGDVAVLKTSDGAYYYCHSHFCTGISEWMDTGPYSIGPAPADAKDFLTHCGKFQGWNLLSADNRLWCVINMRSSGNRDKSLRVWISSGDNTNRTTLFDRRYNVAGEGGLVSYHTRWLTNNNLAVDIFDCGDFYESMNSHQQQSNHLKSLTFHKDSRTGRFTD